MQARLYAIDTALLTQRCVIRRFRENEGPALLKLIRDSQDHLYDNYPSLSEDVGEGPDEAEAYVRRCIAAWLLQQDYAFGVWNNETTLLVGYVHLVDIDWAVPAAGLRFFVDPAHGNQGYATEIVARVLRFAFRQLELEKVYFTALTDNYPGHRLARKVGFTREGDLRGEFRKGSGALADVIRFGLSRETYGE